MMRKNSVLRKYMSSILLFLLFETVAIMLWIAKDNLFYLLNFSYIGGCLALGTALFTAGKHYARHFVQLTVGSYMLLYLGIISCENMQIENKCVHCSKCLQVCPMNVEVNKESRKRKNGTECILCYECTKACPTKALY